MISMSPSRFWVGPEEPHRFLDTFMRTDQEIPENKLSKLNFQAIPARASNEEDICGPFVRMLQLYAAYMC